MRLRVVSGEGTFFDLFEQLADKVREGAEELLALLNDYGNLDRRATRPSTERTSTA